MGRVLIIILITGFALHSPVAAQLQPIKTEYLKYSVYYRWGFVWINGGVLILSSKPDTLDGQVHTKLEGIGKSASKWSWLFELNDHYTSWCNPTSSLPTKSIKNTSEGGYCIHNQYLFNYNDSLIYITSEENQKPLTFDTINLTKRIFDAQSATNYLRYLNHTNYHPGDTIILHILMDGVLQDQEIVFNGKRVLSDDNGFSYPTLKYTAIVTGNKLFSSSDAISVWISDNDDRIPLFIKANITIGGINIFYMDVKLEETHL